MEYSIDIRRSRRKTIGFEIREAGILIVRAPYHMNRQEIAHEISRHRNWIDKHMCKFQELREKCRELPPFSREEIEKMAEEALRVIPSKVKKYAAVIGVDYGRITIRNQRTRWGSCSSKGNLNFNCLLIQTPESVMDYVIVHELCHRIEMNHSQRFWNLVESILPDYKEQRKWLKENGSELIERIS